MSNPTRYVRQPGGQRKAVPCTSNCDCGGCNSDGRPDSVKVTFAGFTGNCASLNADFTLPFVASNSSGSGTSCLWEISGVAAGVFTVAIGVQLNCDPMTGCNLEVTVFDDTGSAQYRFDTSAGDYGNTKCRGMALTPPYDGGQGAQSLCSDQSAATCTVTSATGGGTPCCCGGQTPPPCFHVCIHDPANGCSNNVDVRMCLSKTNPLTYTGSGSDGSTGGASATLTYDSTSGSWTLTYSCNGGPEQSYTFTPGNGWSVAGDGMILTAQSGPIQIYVAKGPVCLPKVCGTTCCTKTGAALSYDVDLGPGGWTAPAVGGIPPYCKDVKGVFTVDYQGGGGIGACAQWGYQAPTYDEYCGAAFFAVGVALALLENPCRWQVAVSFAALNQPSGTRVTYESDAIDPTDCISAADLHKVSEVFNDCDCPFCACNGSMPDTISIAPVL